jgi:membrane-associated phospholipid phosphatase
VRLFVVALFCLCRCRPPLFAGRPRPNFISYTGYNATSEIYTLPHNLRDAFQSFPSGHASTSFAGLGFLSLWLYANLYRYWRLGGAGGGILAREDGAGTDDQTVYERRKRRSARLTGLHDNQLPLLLLLSGPLWLAAFIAFSRVRDNHHNYDDILAGSVLGSFIAVATFAALYTGRSHEWRSINEAAFRMQLQQEEDEENRAAGRDGGSGRRAPELHPLTGPEQPHPSRPHAHAQLGVPSLDLEAAIHKPGASPVPPHRQQQQQDSGARGEPISPSSSSSSAASGSDGRGPRAVAVGPPRFDSLRDVHGGDGGGITTAAGAEDASAGEVRLHQIV